MSTPSDPSLAQPKAQSLYDRLLSAGAQGPAAIDLMAREIQQSLEKKMSVVNAAEAGDFDRCLALVKEGRSVHEFKRGFTALHHAARAGRDDLCIALLDAGAKVEVTDLEGQTALHLAAEAGRSMASLALISRGASPKDKDLNGSDALDKAVRSGDVATVLAVVHHDVALRDDRLLICALKDGRTDLFMSMLDVGFDPTICHRDDSSCLHVAAESGNALACRRLLADGMDPDFSKKPPIQNLKPPLYAAIAAKSFDAALELIKAGASLNELYAGNLSPLETARKTCGVQFSFGLQAYQKEEKGDLMRIECAAAAAISGRQGRFEELTAIMSKSDLEDVASEVGNQVHQYMQQVSMTDADLKALESVSEQAIVLINSKMALNIMKDVRRTAAAQTSATSANKGFRRP